MLMMMEVMPAGEARGVQKGLQECRGLEVSEELANCF